MNITLINPNSTASMTVKCHAAACSVASPTTRITSVNPEDSPASLQGYLDVAHAVVPMLRIMEAYPDSDAFIIACFDDSGLAAARCLTDKPVIGIGEAAFHMASIISCKFSVVTTLRRSIPGITENLKNYGLMERCAGVRASEISVLDLEKDDPNTLDTLNRCIRKAIEEDGAEAIVLGCAGMTNLTAQLAAEHKLPVIDGVTAAVGLGEALVRCGLRTSKIGGYGQP